MPELPHDRTAAAGSARAAQLLGRWPPTLLLLLALLAIQLGSALATVLFSGLGPAGTTLASVTFSAAILTVLARPAAGGLTRNRILLVLAYGVTTAGMNLPFFLAIERIPLGIATTIAFAGPLGLAAVVSRRLQHFLWIGLACLGIALLTPAVGGQLDPVGLGFAALSAAAWTAFVPISKWAGRSFGGFDGLTLGMWAAALMLIPLALAEGSLFGAGAVHLAGALAVALLGFVLPMVLEFSALQRMRARTYGVLVTLEPAIGVIVGAVFLSQAIELRSAAAVACVTAAALGITLSDRHDDR